MYITHSMEKAQLSAEKGAGRDRLPWLRLVLVRQQERRHAAVSLGDDPEAVLAMTLGGLRRIDSVGRQDAVAEEQSLEVAGPIVITDVAPITADVAR